MEVDEKGNTDKDFIFEEKRQKALEKNLGCKFIRINTSKERHMQATKPVESKNLFVNLKTNNY